jgi:DNA replication protein DnaC
MDELVLLKPYLKRLKLTGMLESLHMRISQAMEERWDYSHFLLNLVTDEAERRDRKQLSRRLAKSCLDPDKTLETFDFTFNPTIHEQTIRELATCSFMERKQLVFFVGPSGVGKSHLAQSLGHEACRRGHEVMCRKTDHLFKWINSGRGDGTHARRLKQVIKHPLLILDDFGLKDLNKDHQEDLYEVIAERYERASTIITSNRDFSEWPLVFSNPLMGSAAMDRLVHRAIKIVIEGKSYRLNNFIKNHLERNPE